MITRAVGVYPGHSDGQYADTGYSRQIGVQDLAKLTFIGGGGRETGLRGSRWNERGVHGRGDGWGRGRKGNGR